MASLNTAGLTPEERALLDQADNNEMLVRSNKTAERISNLPEREKAEKMREILEKAIEDAKLSDDRKERFVRQVMDKVEELDKKATSDRQKEIVKRFEGRFQLLNGKWFPAGLRMDAKVKIQDENAMKEVNKMLDRGIGWKVLRGIGRLSIVGNVFMNASNEIDAENIDDLISHYGALEVEINENKEQLDALQAAYKTDAEWDKLAQEMREQARKEKGNKYFSGEYWNIRSTIKKMKEEYQAKADDRSLVEKIYKKSKIQELLDNKKTLEKQKRALEKAVESVTKLQADAEKMFDHAYGKEVESLQQFSGREYDEKLADLRQRVRDKGSRMNRVYFEYFLNKKLNLSLSSENPHILHSEADMDAEKDAYREPVNEREKAEEVIEFGKWWKKFFNVPTPPPVAEVQKLIETLKVTNQRPLLRDILKNDLKPEMKDLFTFFFHGKITDARGTRTLDPARRLPHTVEATTKLLKKIPDFMKKVKDAAALRRASFDFMYSANDPVDSNDFKDFEALLLYPTQELPISDKEKKLREIAQGLSLKDIYSKLPRNVQESINEFEDRVKLGNIPSDVEAKAKSLQEMEEENRIQFREAIDRIRTTFDALVEFTGLGGSQDKVKTHLYDESKSWIYWEMAMYRDIFKNRAPANGLSVGNPLESRSIQDEIALGKFGELLYANWNLVSDPGEKRKIIAILNNKGRNAPGNINDSIDDLEQLLNQTGQISQAEYIEMGKLMHDILLYIPPAAPSPAGAGPGSPTTPGIGPSGGTP